MAIPRAQLAIAAGAGALLLMVFFGYLIWLDHQGPVLTKSEDHDPLSGVPVSISLNPLRDRTSERVAQQYLDAMRDGNCSQLLAQWEKDYRRKYARFICDSETKHPLLSWKIVDWEDAPPLRILHYRGRRRTAPAESATYKELISLTLENKEGAWEVTKYDAMY